MVLEFAVENFRSIRSLQVLNLEAEALQPRYRWLEKNVAHPDERHRVLKTKVIYGANAAGKSNFMMALSFFNFAVGMSANTDSSIMDRIEPFAFDETSSELPSHFEIRLLIDGVAYRYGFTALSGKGVMEEWLFGTPGKKEVMYFIREGQDLRVSKTHLKSVSKILGALDDEKALYGPQTLLLSHLGLLKNKEIGAVYRAITSLKILNGALVDRLDQSTINGLSNSEKQQKTKQLLERAGIDLGEIYVMDTIVNRKGDHPLTEITLLGDPLPEDGTALWIAPPQLTHRKVLGFRADTHLSKGTIKMIMMASAITDALEKGQCLIIDEFEARLHTNLSRAIVEAFHDPETNPNDAQLIVATHDTNLLDQKLMRRDQIAFVDKGEEGASRIYSLSDIKGVRNDASFEKEYLIGKYGGVPAINSL